MMCLFDVANLGEYRTVIFESHSPTSRHGYIRKIIYQVPSLVTK